MTTPLIFAPQAGGGEISIGDHVERHFLGLAFNIDTIWALVTAAVLVIVLGVIARRALTKDTDDHVPTKLQLFWETIVNQVNVQVKDNLGAVHPYVAPLAIALFFFILFANWLELLPTEINDKVHLTPAPTADVNVTYALGLFAMVSVWTYGIRQKGLGGYLKHFVEPYPVLLPLNLIEELVKPFTLALRLFGNIFAGGILLSVIALLPFYANAPLSAVWKLADLAIGGIQAFIFALLTVLYFAAAGAGHDDESHAHDETHADDESRTEQAQPALAS